MIAGEHSAYNVTNKLLSVCGCIKALPLYDIIFRYIYGLESYTSWYYGEHNIPMPKIVYTKGNKAIGKIEIDGIKMYLVVKLV